MCSGVGLVMVAVVGAVVFARRGRQVALFHVVPLAACYAAWFVTTGRNDSAVGHVGTGAVVRFAATGVRAAFGAMGPAPVFGIAFGILLGAGLVVAVAQRRRRPLSGWPRRARLLGPLVLPGRSRP